MKMLVLSRYGSLGASSRYRSFQFLPYLEAQGIEAQVIPLLEDDYLRRKYAGLAGSKVGLLAAYGRRVATLLGARSFDLVWVEKELLPWAPLWFERLLLATGRPVVFDYDDAIFHLYDTHDSALVRGLYGRKIDLLMRHASLVTAGNAYLAERAIRAGAARVKILPTVIDLERYPLVPFPKNERFTIGWIGSPATTHYLRDLAPVFREICRDGQAEVVAIGAGPLSLEGVPLRILPWSEATEVRDLQGLDVGIMPLTDDPWSRGKCGFKLIQYMACATPVVGSPVGVNRELIEEGRTGFQVATPEDWVRALRTLQADGSLRRKLGAAGRAKVERDYCLQVTAPRLAEHLHAAARRTRVRN